MKEFQKDTHPNSLISFIPAPFDVGQPYTGVQSAPESILSLEFQKILSENHLKFEIDPFLIEFKKKSPSYRTLNEFLRISKNIFNRVAMHAREKKFCLTLGGDHSIAFGSIAAMLDSHPDLCVLWIDAHGDLNTPDSSPSGNFHGMPLAALLNQKPELWLHKCPWFQNKLDPKRIILIGIRDLDPPEKELIQKLSLNVWTAEDIRNYGMPYIWDKIKTSLKELGHPPLHLSFDIDGCDPRSAPATGTPVLNGLTPEDTFYFLKKINETKQLISMDLVEVNPSMPMASSEIQKTLKLAQNILLETLGVIEFNPSKISLNTPKPTLDHLTPDHAPPSCSP